MASLVQATVQLSPRRQSAIEWFWNHAGHEVGWREILDGTGYPITSLKGIYKPAGEASALSIRRSLGSNYEDTEIISDGNAPWTFRYFQEGHDLEKGPKLFTYRSMEAARVSGIPLGVIQQINQRPARYVVVGLGRVVGFDGGFFSIEGLLNADGLFPTRGVPVTGFDGSVDNGETPPVSAEDARRRTERAIVARQGAGKFRTDALVGFGNRCAISDCDVVDALEAAHIVSYLGPQTNVLANTLLLRADLHTLFDRGRFTIDPDTLKVSAAPMLTKGAYKWLEGREVRRPEGVSFEAFRANLRAALESE